MTHSTDTAGSSAQCLDRAIARLFDTDRGGLDPNATGKHVTTIHQRTPRVPHPNSMEKIKATAALDDSADAPVTPKSVKPVKTERWYVAQMTSETSRLFAVYFREEVLLPKPLSQAAMATLSDLDSSAKLKVKLEEKTGSPRLKVVELQIGDESFTLEAAIQAAEAAAAAKAVESTPVVATPVPTTSFTGTLKWFNPTKGYGFIVPDNRGEDVFLHISQVEKAHLTSDQLPDGQRLRYQLVPSQNGGDMAGHLKLAD